MSGKYRNRIAVLLVMMWALLLGGDPVPTAFSQDSTAPESMTATNRSRIKVNSDPSGSRVSLNGQRAEGVTPLELSLNPGQHSLTVNAEGYQPLTHEITISSGGSIEMEFILLKTPPEPPTPEELRALSPPLGSDDPNSDYWAEAKPRHLANESCRECHSGIMPLHAGGEHRTLACENCHSALSKHVEKGKVIGEMEVTRGEGIQNLCMMCHDRDNRHKIKEPARTIQIQEHLTALNVRPVNRCEDCHHVHDPQKWVREAREMVGLPEMMASIPMIHEKSAKQKSKKYYNAAEIFLVAPLAMGLAGMAVSEGEGEFPYETVIVSGLALSAGAYLYGQYVESRELKKIRALNEERRAANVQVKNHNRLVQEAMADHQKEVETWIEESEGRGIVLIDE